MNSEEIFDLNIKIQKMLNKLSFEELVDLTASELHEIWKKTTFYVDKETGETKQVEKWKKLNPNENEEENKYVQKILSDERFFTLPYVRKEEDGNISIDIGKMKYSQLSPHWQKENKEAAEVAVELTLDNYVYLSNPTQREVLVKVIGSAIHLLWKNRPANAWAKNTELAARYSNLPIEEQKKDDRHIFIAEKAIEYLSKKMGIDKDLEDVKKLKNSSKR